MIDKENRLNIYNAIMSLGNIWGDNSSMDKVDFLENIWTLRLMASTDSRYSDAAGDARKHLVDNDDWDDDYTFLDRFKLLDCNEQEFIKFVETSISPYVRTNKEEIEKYVTKIEKLLPADFIIREVDVIDSKPLLKIESTQNNTHLYPYGVNDNDVPFCVNQKPSCYPSFELRYNSWDDYGYKTSFELICHLNKDEVRIIGRVKILSERTSSTIDVIPSSFLFLENEFCSLGQNESYYNRLKSLFPHKYESILYALKDVAFFPEIYDRYEGLFGFGRSLMRNAGNESIVLKIKRKLERGDRYDNWDFSFDAKLPYCDDKFRFTLNFGDLEDEDNPYRIKALIGPNGAGKTSILKSLVEQLIRREGVFLPERPVFSKIIAISFSIFDTFINIRGRSVLNYCYCGLHNTEDSLLSQLDQDRRLKEALNWIYNCDKKAYRKFENSLQIFFPKDIIESFIDEEGEIMIDKAIEIVHKMSSGESMIFNLVASLYANMRNNTLIVFDEMEVHLHPNAIRNMMKLLFKITRQYNSACLLATHSSIVIQELLADNVSIIEKNEFGFPVLKVLNHESLGENLSVINDDIFGNNTIAPHYDQYISKIASESSTIDEAITKLSSANLPQNLSLYFHIRSAFEKCHEKI